MRKCFVCMPLIEEFRPLYDQAILPEVRDALGAGWECAKADDDRLPGMVTERVVCALLNADLVIAVTADPRPANSINPNVMYELGVAHSFRKPTLLVADSASELPFDLRAVETILADFSRYQEPKLRGAFISELRRSLRRSLAAPEMLTNIEHRRIPRNPVTTQLTGTSIFVEDLEWLWGYGEVLRRECVAQTVWEITRDLFWPAEKLFFATIKGAIRQGRKHYFLIPNDDGVLRKAAAILNQLRLDLPADEIDELIRFIAIDRQNFLLWPIAIVLYDANLATRSGGIVCEPMTSEIGNDRADESYREMFAEHLRAGGNVDSYLRSLAEVGWIERHREATFDICLDRRVVETLATTFTRLWNEGLHAEAARCADEQQRDALLQTWLITSGRPD
jgi:hypothetical protein